MFPGSGSKSQGCHSIIWDYLGQISSGVLSAGTLEKMEKLVKERL